MFVFAGGTTSENRKGALLGDPILKTQLAEIIVTFADVCHTEGTAVGFVRHNALGLE